MEGVWSFRLTGQGRFDSHLAGPIHAELVQVLEIEFRHGHGGLAGPAVRPAFRLDDHRGEFGVAHLLDGIHCHCPLWMPSSRQQRNLLGDPVLSFLRLLSPDLVEALEVQVRHAVQETTVKRVDP